MLEVEHLRFSFGAREVLRGVDLRAEPGELVFVLGANGAGKTTLFRCILGLLPGYQGCVRVDGCDVSSLAPRALAKKIAYIPQTSHMIFPYTALELVLMGPNRRLGLFSAPGRRERANAMEALEELGIANIGLANARMICRAFDYELDRMLAADQEDLSEISGIGDVIAGAFVAYFQDPVHRRRLEDLLKELTIVEEEGAGAPQTLAGLTFVITGSVTHFANRSEVKTLIESLGGKVTGSVTSKTDYLINNDVESTSLKNKKARELGIPILSEEEFLEMTQGEGQ